MAIWTKEEATTVGKQLLNKMTSKGWRLEVWTNDDVGWHAKIVNGPMCIHAGDSSGYYIYMSNDCEMPVGDCGIWCFQKEGNFGADPNELVRRKIDQAYRGLRPYVQALARAEQILETEA